MSDDLNRYLTQCYQRDILRESVEIAPLATTEEQIAEIKAEIARIDALKLGSNLASRDFVSYQNRRVLVSLLAELEGEAAVTKTRI
jgi:hypothetical protein